MQEALGKFRAKCEFLEKAYAQLIAMDAASFERYNKENQEVIALALQINEKAGKAIKHVKTVAQANLQDATDSSQSHERCQVVRVWAGGKNLRVGSTLWRDPSAKFRVQQLLVYLSLIHI